MLEEDESRASGQDGSEGGVRRGSGIGVITAMTVVTTTPRGLTGYQSTVIPTHYTSHLCSQNVHQMGSDILILQRRKLKGSWVG